jgi:glycosyltransferase involved in cell wall biosynthesis
VTRSVPALAPDQLGVPVVTATGRRPRRLVSVGHSYCVAFNRRLASEMAKAGAGRWDVTAVAPSFFHGDLRPIPLERLADETCRLEDVPAHFTRRVQMMLYGGKLRRILREGWDLVHCWEEPYIPAAGQIVYWTPKTTALVFWTAQNLSKRYPPPFNVIERYCLERCAGWLACGESIVRTLLPRGYDRRPHRIMPLGVDLERFRPDRESRALVRARLGWSEGGPPVVGYLGRFVPEKGLGLLMDVLDEVATPWRALFLGKGPMESALRQWAGRHGDKVSIVTTVKHDEVPSHIAAMDVVCAPSQTMPWWREQFGRMLIEAFACRVPVIASDSGEIPYVVADAGRIIAESDRGAWVCALGELLDNSALREELGGRGLERVRQHYTWEVIARRHLAFFDELIEGSANDASS